MVTRDPETGQFRSGQKGAADPYINAKHLFYTNTWGADDASDNDFDEVIGGGNRNSLKQVEIDRPEDHLVEIHGVSFNVSDYDEGGKCQVWVVNDMEVDRGGFVADSTAYGDDLIAHYAVGVDNTNGHSDTSTNQVWLPKPMLSTGEIGVKKRSGTVDSGEIGATIYYSLREFDENTVVQQLLQNR